MKSIHLLYIIAGIVLLAGCRKGYQELQQLPTVIKTVYPAHFLKQEAGNVDLTIININTGQEFKIQTDALGRVNVPGLINGEYNVHGFKMISPEEAFELTKVADAFPVNGTARIIVNAENGETVIRMIGSNAKPLLFKEIYYTGSRTPSNGTYFSDQYYEIYNNTDSVMYADGLCIGNTGGAPGNTPTARTWGFRDETGYVYMQNVWMIPGSGHDHPIPPGTSIIIAQDGIDHKTDPLGNPASPVNLGLGIANWESYVPRADNRDLDSDVPNLQSVYLGSVGFDWLTSVFGPGMVIFRHKDVANLPLFTEPGSTSTAQFMQVPVDSVFDAVDCLANPTAINFKRIPASIDAGFNNCTGTYTGEALRRKVARVENGRRVLQDLNNSTVDFEMVKPPVVRW
ncbi:MAG: DUF4876 domain-containing protein [Pseudobacter sp.]|uniref:DUF4876 domain-containing protein n=1 Tax=Pseudobacter sp. TaxID=2045420 RepID=UPI003F81603E